MRILTGIQSSGIPHIGNIIGAIEPALTLSNKEKDPAFFFIADLHSITSIKDPKILKENILHVAAAWLACGLDLNKDILYRQSRIPYVCELMWYLNCFTPYQMLINSHAFKEKSSNVSNVNIGLFTYPVLMAADILLYDADVVPVGKDQIQHLEITRDIAKTINAHFPKTFTVPNASINNTITVPGINGKKMSKSYNNTINIFDNTDIIKKAVMKIITNSTPIDEPKNPDTCTVFALYSLIATPEKIENLKNIYLNDKIGYSDIKQLLYEEIISKYQNQKEKYMYYIQNPSIIENILSSNEERIMDIAKNTLYRLKNNLGII